MIHEAFINSLGRFQVPKDQMISLWKQVEEKYTNSNRYYHNLSHLNNFLVELIPLKSKFQNWEVIVLAIVYHDIVYNPLKKNNEEKSADLAVKELTKIDLAHDLIKHCSNLIIATKKHESSHQEIKLFTDADLAILGKNADQYRDYTKQIRKEYSIYPDFLYYPGRKKVLMHFLNKKRIYLSNYFYDQYEIVAKDNLEKELYSIL